MINSKMKNLLTILFILAPILSWGQDTTIFDYGAVSSTGTIVVDAASVTSGGFTITTGYAGTGTNAAECPLLPANTNDYVYNGSSLTTTIDGISYSNVTAWFFISHSWNDYEMLISANGTQIGSIESIVGNTSLLKVDNIPVVNDSIRFTIANASPANYAYLSAIVITEYEVTQCDTTEINITLDSINHIPFGGSGAIGDIYISVDGDNPHFTYSWTGGATTQDLENVVAGSYTVTVTDNEGCTHDTTIVVLDGNSVTPTFYSNFEDQNTDPENISSDVSLYLETGTSGEFAVVANPDPDSRNTSSYVLRTGTNEGTGGRAEYTVLDADTDEKTYIYKWKRYYPADMFDGVGSFTVMNNQWKTYPCEYYNEIYEDDICYGGGIFTDHKFDDQEVGEIALRAEPSCNALFYPIPRGEWIDYTFEVYWTKTNQGYYRFWVNDSLVGYADHTVTLFDSWVEGTCDMDWSTGQYTIWTSTGKTTLYTYADDVTMYDVDSGYTANAVCPDCEVAPPVQTDSIEYHININCSFPVQDYNMYITRWDGQTSITNVASVYGQNYGMNISIPAAFTETGTSLTPPTDCFDPYAIGTRVTWTGASTYQIELEGLDPTHTYKVQTLAHSTAANAHQIWTTEANRDTVVGTDNICNMAELTGLTPEADSTLSINIATVDGLAGFLNAINITEYAAVNETCDTVNWVTPANITNVTEYGGSDGAIDLSVSGGHGDYTYLWSNSATTQDLTGLSANTYTVTVTDDSSCTTTASYTVTQPAAPDPCEGVTISVTGVVANETNGDGTGAINITASGGTSPYTYDWGGGITTEDRTGLSAGTYNVTVTDANTCTGTGQFIVENITTSTTSGVHRMNVRRLTVGGF